MIRRLVIFALVLLAVQAAVFQMKMSRHDGKGTKLLKEGKAHEYRAFREVARREYKHRLDHYRHATRASRLAATKPLYDYGDQIYIVNVTAGTPPQQFRLFLDTFSGDTWIVDSTCTKDICGCDGSFPNCDAKRTFDSSKSSTYVKDGRQFLENNTGGFGFLGQDTIGLGDTLQVPKVTFGQVDTPFPYITQYPMDGFLGLTYKSDDGVKSVIQEASDQKLIDQPVFTIFYGTDGIDSQGQVGGQITYGGVDTTNCDSTINYVKVLSQNQWEFNVDSVEISGKKQSGSPWIGIADPTSAIIGLPEKAFNDVVAATNAVFNQDFGIYQVDCDAQFQWTVTLSKQQFTVNQDYGVIPYEGMCFLAFELFDYPGFDIILGSPFLRDYCQVYDITGKLGFAKIINN